MATVEMHIQEKMADAEKKLVSVLHCSKYTVAKCGPRRL